MRHDFKTESCRLTITPLSEADLEPLRLLRNAKKQFFISQGEIMPGEQRVWFEKYLEKPGDFMFRASLKNDAEKRFIGACALYDLDTKSHRAEFGRLLVDTAWTPKGCGFELTQAVCRLGFESLGLQRIVLDVWEDNTAALRVYEKTGFYEIDRRDGLVFMQMSRET